MDFNNFKDQTFNELPEVITGSNFENCTFNASAKFERCNIKNSTFTKDCNFFLSNVIACKGVDNCNFDKSNNISEEEENDRLNRMREVIENE